MALFHIETQRLGDGSWSRFTSTPIEGREAAEQHLAGMIASAVDFFGRPLPPARLHELTEAEIEDERVRTTLGQLTAEQREKIVLDFVRSQPEAAARLIAGDDALPIVDPVLPVVVPAGPPVLKWVQTQSTPGAEAYQAEYAGFRFEVAEDDGDWSYAYVGPHDAPFDHQFEWETKEEAMKAAGQVAHNIYTGDE